MDKPIGIDLGTTMSAMAIIDDLGQPQIIRNNKGETLTPSAILIRGNERTVGEPAKRSAVARPENVVMFIKRSMHKRDFTFEDDTGNRHTPEELSGLILRKLKQDAAAALGAEVKQAVITVPAYFGDLERNRTKQAGEIAGLEVIDIINEPTAAAIAYGLSGGVEQSTILVYDLGGGTFDVTIMQVESRSLRVLTSNGHRRLGGADFDDVLAKYFAEKFQAAHGMNPLDDLKFYQDFRDRAEQAKKDLSDTEETYVNLSAAGKFLDLELQRAEFEKLIGHYVDQTQFLTEEALKDARLTWTQVDKVLLVGGSTRIPAVRRMVQKLTGREPETGINPDEVVAIGAAVYAANERGITVRNRSGKALPKAQVSNVTAHSLGIITENPDTGKKYNSKLIRKDTPIPAAGKDIFSTITDNQTAVRLQLVQGEAEDPEQCDKVGDAGMLMGIPPKPRGVPQIEVTLSYDGSGIVHLHAREMESGKELRTQIEYTALLSQAEVQQAASKAEALTVR
jgi:molecular chaperone DnaK